MTDTAVTLVWCAAILLVFCGAGWAADSLLDRRDRRRKVKKQLRRVRRYRATADAPGRVVYLDQHSRKVA